MKKIYIITGISILSIAAVATPLSIHLTKAKESNESKWNKITNNNSKVIKLVDNIKGNGTEQLENISVNFTNKSYYINGLSDVKVILKSDSIKKDHFLGSLEYKVILIWNEKTKEIAVKYSKNYSFKSNFHDQAYKYFATFQKNEFKDVKETIGINKNTLINDFNKKILTIIPKNETRKYRIGSYDNFEFTLISLLPKQKNKLGIKLKLKIFNQEKVFDLYYDFDELSINKFEKDAYAYFKNNTQEIDKILSQQYKFDKSNVLSNNQETDKIINQKNLKFSLEIKNKNYLFNIENIQQNEIETNQFEGTITIKNFIFLETKTKQKFVIKNLLIKDFKLKSQEVLEKLKEDIEINKNKNKILPIIKTLGIDLNVAYDHSHNQIGSDPRRKFDKSNPPKKALRKIIIEKETFHYTFIDKWKNANNQLSFSITLEYYNYKKYEKVIDIIIPSSDFNQ